MSRIRFFKALLAVLALTICTGTLSAVTLVANPTSLTLHCDQGLGPTAAPVGITLAAAGNALNVTVTASNAAVVLPNPATLSVSSTSVATNFNFTMASACAGATNNQQVTLTFTPASGTALTVVATLAVTTPTIAASQNSITLNCDTYLGPAPAVNVGITLLSAGAGFNVTIGTTTANAALVGVGGPIVLPNPASKSVSSTTVATTYAISMSAGCKGFVPGTTPTTVPITFTPAAGTGGLTVTATLSVTNSTSALAVAPGVANISCIKSGTTYSNLTSTTVNVTSAANQGTPFTVNTSASQPIAFPSWLSVSAGGTATTSAVQLTVQPVTGCGGLPVGTTTYQVHLSNPPAPDKLFTVNLQIGATSTLAPNPTSISMTYQETTGTPTYTTHSTSIGATTPAVFFSVDTSTVPLWLTVSPLTGTTSSAQTLYFTPNSGVQTLALGGYTANVHLKVSGQLDTVIPVYLQVVNAASTLGAAEGNAQSTSWTIGSTLPVFVITPVSTDSPISYTVAPTNGTLYPQLSATQGVAYAFGSSPVLVTFTQAVFGAVTPSTPSLTGAVVFTYGGGTTYTVNLTVNIKSPGAAITALSPSTVPTATTGTVTVGIVGTGFVTGSASLATNAGLVINGIIVPDNNVSAAVNNSTSIVLTITVPAAGADPYLTMNAAGTIIIGVCNPGGTTCSTPTSTATLTVGVNPIIQSVTPASSYVEVTPPTLQSISPYDILSVFGTNFCISGGTGCTGGNALLYGSLDPITLRYLTTITPDNGARNVSVAFQTHASTPVAIANAPLLFATNNQINLIVPDAVKGYIGNAVDMVVTFGTQHSAPYTVSVVATDPGIFTLSGDGQGEAAAESSTYALIGSDAPAVARSTQADSDTISIYVTGLGVPDSDGTGTAVYSATCMPYADYFANVNAAFPSANLQSDDGLVMQSAFFDASSTEPCIKATSSDVPTVTIGNVSAPVKYAGWVTGAIAGLYQINVQLPASGSTFTNVAGTQAALTGTAAHLPVVVTANGKSSLATGVNLWAVRGLKVTYTGATSGTHGQAWGGSALTVTDASGNWANYTVTEPTGTLPDGLTVNDDGTITGPLASDAAGSTVTFLVTDTTLNITGTVTVTFTIN